MPNDQPPPLWSLVKKWRGRDWAEATFHDPRSSEEICADELAKLLREHVKLLHKYESWPQEPDPVRQVVTSELVERFILGIPPEEPNEPDQT